MRKANLLSNVTPTANVVVVRFMSFLSLPAALTFPLL